MGDWYESCALTNLPITHGDEVVVVAPNPGVEPFLHREHSHSAARRKIACILRGHYSGYGLIEEHPEFEGRGYDEWVLWFRSAAWDAVQHRYQELKVGEHYRREIDFEERTESFLLKHEAEVAEMHGGANTDLLENMKRPKLGVEDSMAITAIVWFANTTRLSLGWRAPCGDTPDLSNHQLLVDLTQRGIDELTQLWLSWRDPEDVAAGEYDDPQPLDPPAPPT